MENQNNGKPFIRWAGGKTWLCNIIQKYLPPVFTDYYEPFLGGGSIFFHLASIGRLEDNIVLSDLNSDLIQAYSNVKSKKEDVINFLCSKTFSSEEYYMLREKYNSCVLSPFERGLYFVYLNLSCFNGIYRVNREGKYNVPFGSGRKPDIENYSLLLKKDSQLLSNADLSSRGFEYILSSDFHLKEKSLVFLDPPYTVSHNNNGFIAYNKKLFSIEQQYELKKVLDKINSEGSYFIMTNAHHVEIKNIFGTDTNYRFYEEHRPSVIGGAFANRGEISEYIVCNFDRSEII